MFMIFKIVVKLMRYLYGHNCPCFNQLCINKTFKKKSRFSQHSKLPTNNIIRQQHQNKCKMLAKSFY